MKMAGADRPEEDLESTDEESSYYRSAVYYQKLETFTTGFVAGMFLTLGVTYLVYVLVPGAECP